MSKNKKSDKEDEKEKTTTTKKTTTKKTTANKSTKKKITKKSATKPKTPKAKKPKKDELGDIDDSLLVEGITYIEENKLESALECFGDFSKKYPKSHFGFYYVGYTKMLQGKSKDAMKNLKKATKLDKKFLPSIYYQGLLEFNEKKWDDALAIFDGIMLKFNSDEIKESNFNIPYFIAICHHYLGNFEAAADYFLVAYNFSPEDPVVLYYKGFNELALKNYDEAVMTFKNLLYIDINNTQFWDLFKGYSYSYYEEEEDD
jgi:tetratricopeptide (TPR) repeat protein